MDERKFSNHRQILNSEGSGRYILHIYINGLLVKRIRGTKRECYKALTKYGVPVFHEENKGLAYYQSNIYKLLELDSYAKDYLIDSGNTPCVVEFELVHTTLFRNKEKRHYYVSPIIGTLSVHKKEDDYDVLYHEMTPVLMRDAFSKYCFIPQIIGGKFPIRCTTDIFVNMKEKYYNPKFTKDFILLTPPSSDESGFLWRFTYDDHFIFHKYVNN